MRKNLLFMTALLCALFISLSSIAQDKLMEVLKSELAYDMEQLTKTDNPPFYMNFRVTEIHRNAVRASFGAVTSTTQQSTRVFVPQVRIGSYDFDNFHGRVMGTATSRFQGPPSIYLPLDDNSEDAIRQIIWKEVDNRYRFAVETIDRLKAAQKVAAEQDDKAPDFSDIEAEKYYEAPFTAAELAFDFPLFEDKLRKYTAVFKENPILIDGDASISYTATRKYFVSSEGAEIAQNIRACRLMLSVLAKTDDGMDLPLYKSYYAFDPKDMPSDETVLADALKLSTTLTAMREAPVVEPYTGPAILSGAASGVFFHEIFGHRVEGQKMKSDSDGQTFKKMVDDYVLPAKFSVYMDPTMKNYHGQDMNGYYVFDDQGVRGERVEVVKDGILKGFLMTRVPIDGFPRSNGHARGEATMDTDSRQSNLVVETSDHLTDARLRELLIEEAKKQGKEFGFLFNAVSGGLTMTGRMGANSFNVNPLEVWKIYVDGRPDELVRGVDLIGTPLSMFANIIEAGGEIETFTGSCGAASGYVPVTASSPSILVQKVEMQRKGKSRNTKPILDRP